MGKNNTTDFCDFTGDRVKTSTDLMFSDCPGSLATELGTGRRVTPAVHVPR